MLGVLMCWGRRWRLRRIGLFSATKRELQLQTAAPVRLILDIAAPLSVQRDAVCHFRVCEHTPEQPLTSETLLQASRPRPVQYKRSTHGTGAQVGLKHHQTHTATFQIG